ncbi:hypothetical protein Rs2_09979 [Raphanus sativus]|nr:hypothetical protein Rs2_09979 [Raphanus sativus]
MVEAVPALTEVVQDGSSSGSEDEIHEEEDTIDDDNAEKKSISPGHARDTDAAGKAIVHSIIFRGEKPVTQNEELEWTDDEGDASVDNLFNLIEQGYPFTHSSFTGGLTKLDVIRLREESKAESLHRKTCKTKHGPSSQIPSGFDIELISAVVKDSLKDDFTNVGTLLAALHESSLSFQTQVLTNLSQMFTKVDECNENIALLTEDRARHPFFGAQGSHGRPTSTPATENAATQTNVKFPSDAGLSGGDDIDGHGPLGASAKIDAPTKIETVAEEQCGNPGGENSSDSSLDPALLFPKPTFSLGLTQEERGVLDKVVSTCVGGVDEVGAVAISEDIQHENEEVAFGCRKSKRPKNPPKSLVGNYECDKRFLNIARQGVASSNNPGVNIDYSAKFSILLDKIKTPFAISGDKWTLDSVELYELVGRAKPMPAKVVDVLISHISAFFRINSNPNQQSTCVFLDTHFVSEICKVYSKFSKMSRKDNFRFPDTVLDVGLQKSAFVEAQRFYFPFNLDQKYWVGICVDMSSWSIYVLDSNISIRTDYMMSKEVRPIAQMFPYFALHLGKPLPSKDVKPLAIERPRCFPQNDALADSALSAILFIKAHAFGGADACKSITDDVLDTEVERLAVTLYEENVGSL